MGDPRGFMNKKRSCGQYRPVCERVKDYRHVAVLREREHSRDQASRCMDCGTPFCHWGCPLGNHIPEWNDLMFKGRWKKAFELLSETNPLPEVTGRICPAPCEWACVLGVNDEPVTVRENELAIAEHAFENGITQVLKSPVNYPERVAVVGSGPAGLSCAYYLAVNGYGVTVYERDELPGGMLRFGIPDFKLEKTVLDRRLDLMKRSGVEFRCSVDIGGDIALSELAEKYDAVCLAGGCRLPRDLRIEGRELSGIHYAMDYLTQSNRRVMNADIPQDELISAQGKKVVVIGGGDTGSDCVGTANRQGADCVVQIELMPRPGESRTDAEPWPEYPLILRTSSSHEEGAERKWSIMTKRFLGDRGRVKGLLCQRVEFESPSPDAPPVMKPVAGSEFELEADLVILAVGFTHPETDFIEEKMQVALDSSGRVTTDKEYRTTRRGLYCAGDMRKGQSLVVWAISEGISAARAIHSDLQKARAELSREGCGQKK